VFVSNFATSKTHVSSRSSLSNLAFTNLQVLKLAALWAIFWCRETSPPTCYVPPLWKSAPQLLLRRTGNLGADWDRNPKSKKNGAESLFVSSFCACSSGLVWASRSQSKRRPMQESLKKFPANANACNPLALWKRAPPSLVECYVCSFWGPGTNDLALPKNLVSPPLQILRSLAGTGARCRVTRTIFNVGHVPKAYIGVHSDAVGTISKVQRTCIQLPPDLVYRRRYSHVPSFSSAYHTLQELHVPNAKHEELCKEDFVATKRKTYIPIVGKTSLTMSHQPPSCQSHNLNSIGLLHQASDGEMGQGQLDEWLAMIHCNPQEIYFAYKNGPF
jgi:hypothetical protein